MILFYFYFDFDLDNPDGNLDSTAFGDYRNKNGFYVYIEVSI